jgi:hypothetical protein
MELPGHVCRDSESGNFEFGGDNMHRAHRYLASLFLTAPLAAPVSSMAAPWPQTASVQIQIDTGGQRS